jgi:hypothetical protein
VSIITSVLLFHSLFWFRGTVHYQVALIFPYVSQGLAGWLALMTSTISYGWRNRRPGFGVLRARNDAVVV